jgi:hypothetical protein
VFEKLLDDASTGIEPGNTLRDDLQDPDSCYRKAHNEVKQRLRRIGVPFGNEHFVMFYEPEEPYNPDDDGICPVTAYPNNHCTHIFYLPEKATEKKVDTRKAVFDVYLKCCYQPWRPQKKK